jgi:hypothetical protein
MPSDSKNLNSAFFQVRVRLRRPRARELGRARLDQAQVRGAGAPALQRGAQSAQISHQWCNWGTAQPQPNVPGFNEKKQFNKAIYESPEFHFGKPPSHPVLYSLLRPASPDQSRAKDGRPQEVSFNQFILPQMKKFGRTVRWPSWRCSRRSSCSGLGETPASPAVTLCSSRTGTQITTLLYRFLSFVSCHTPLELSGPPGHHFVPPVQALEHDFKDGYERQKKMDFNSRDN